MATYIYAALAKCSYAVAIHTPRRVADALVEASAEPTAGTPNAEWQRPYPKVTQRLEVSGGHSPEQQPGQPPRWSGGDHPLGAWHAGPSRL